MEQPLFLDFQPHDNLSETLSTDTASLNQLHSADISPTNVLSVNSIDSEIGQGSKKIRKKRAAYQKIDDDIRLKLLEAVQRGETLKSAAKRYQVNYSSAKSIFHIFRKEGRILKKATTEKGFGFDFPGQPQSEGELQGYPQQGFQQNNVYANNNFQNYGFQQAVQNLEHNQNNFYHSARSEKSGSSSPLNGLVNNFADLLRISNQGPTNPNEEFLRNKNPHVPIHPSRFNPASSPTHALLQLQQQQQQQTQASTFGQMSQLAQMNQMNQVSQQLNQLNQLNQMNQINLQRNQGFNPVAHQMAQITLASMPTNANTMSPSERMKQFDNFYMNYNNSPLSGNRGMIREGSESGSNRYLQQPNEFDSFSEMVTALQSQSHLTDSLKKTEAMAKLQTPTVQHQNSMEKIDMKLIAEEDAAWNGNLGTAALDTFKSFVDAQMVLNNAFKKAAVLNNLVQIQKAKTDGSPSPKFMTFQGN